MKLPMLLPSIVLALLVAACSEPVPQAKASYVGQWRAESMLLDIRGDGRVHYERRGERGKTTVDAPIQRFEGDNFVVGMGPFSTTFVVSKPPHADGATWKMTVDGVELTRTAAPGESTA
jgi:hypothetical protein